MNKALMALIAVGGIVFFIKSCGPSRAKAVSFEGRWTLETESEVSGSKNTKEVSVQTDGKRFRLTERVTDLRYMRDPIEYETTLVYDGERLREKTVYLSKAENSPFTPEPQTGERKPATGELDGLRFWQRSFSGNAGPGGRIAGQETLLYQTQARRPDAEITVQAWVDAKTGIVLRSNESVFSKQTNSVFSKITGECKEIRYGPVAETAFSPPSS
jgi:hypothetical protein